MTGPVDTDVLRSSSRFLRKAYPGTAAQVYAAADEVDRLRRELAQNDPSFWQEQSDTWKRLANDEHDVTNLLRAVIENAPHAPQCQAERFHLKDYSLSRCTCWKAEAL